MQISIADQVIETLNDYVDEVRVATNEAIEKTAKEAVKKLKSTSPRRPNGGRYAKGWTIKKERAIGNVISIIVHNKTDYQLTHLLEKGHVIKNGKGEFGRVAGIKHIEPVEQWAIRELPDEIERKLQ